MLLPCRAFFQAPYTVIGAASHKLGRHLLSAGRCRAELASTAVQRNWLPPIDPRKVVIITGPTAVGKTRASLELAKRLGGEIISADSVQVYKGLDVGSDKAPVEERGGVAHHLIDILEPQQDFSAADFFARARGATADILQRGKVPIVVGGTGFYLRWFVHGRPNTPAPDPKAAAEAEAILHTAWQHAAQDKPGSEDLTPEERWQAGVQAVAAAGDPQAAEKLGREVNNYYRLRRVLEVLVQTGRPRAELDLDLAAPMDYDFRCFVLNSARQALLRRIDARCESMVSRGLLEEAQLLLHLGIQPDSNCASKSIGYRQAMLYLQHCHQDPDLASPQGLLQMVTEMQSASRQLSKRQLHWFRGDPLYQWIDASRGLDAAVNDISASLQLDRHPGGKPGDGQLSKEDMKELRVYQTEFNLMHGQTLEEAVARVRLLLNSAASKTEGSTHSAALAPHAAIA